jgi:hypothetical protein
MIGVGSYCCTAVETPAPSSKTSRSWALLRFCFFGFGIGVMNFATRRVSMICPVGWPSASSSQWRDGYSYGELRIGRSKNALSIRAWEASPR